MEIQELRAELDAWLAATDLFGETNLQRRAEALDFVHFVREVVRMQRPAAADDQALLADAEGLATRINAVNGHLFTQRRAEIRHGTLRGQVLRGYLEQFTDYSQPTNDHVYTSYDGLDVLLDGLFALATAPGPTLIPTVEMVHCEETPARVLLDLIDQCALGPDDVFYDLGSGLGQVVLLIHLLTGAKAKGVEIEPTFCHFAQEQAAALGLTGVEFVNSDARAADYQDGTVFFLFTPFRGQLLRAVLTRLEAAAQGRSIRVCTFGSCTPRVAEAGWLRPVSADANHEYKLIVFTNQVR